MFEWCRNGDGTSVPSPANQHKGLVQMVSTYVLEMEGISKSFPGVRALKDVTLRVKPGEVHALVGANGAGKSTLLKIMYGAYSADKGVIRLDGREIRPSSPSHAQKLGISLVHQEQQLIPELNVAQNMFLGREYTWAGLVNSRRCIAEAEALLEKLGVRLDVTVPVRTLGVAQRQMIDIAKALLVNAKVIAFDEPTSSLTPVETEKLFETIRGLKSQGVGIVYVSHRLEELPLIADRVTVFRDGEVVGSGPMSEMDHNTLVRLMTGHESVGQQEEADYSLSQNQPEVLRVVNVKVGQKVKGVSFEVHKGEILGITGLVGAGR